MRIVNLNDLYPLAAPFALGIGLGVAYYGGLWVTLRRIARARRPALEIVGGYFARLMVMAVCFILLVRGGHWDRLLACLAGVVLVQAALAGKNSRKRLRKLHSPPVTHSGKPGEG